jgi:hypothetical protein
MLLLAGLLSSSARRPDPMSHERWRPDGELAAKISNIVLRALAGGRGSTKAKATHGDNGAFVVLHDSPTRGEQTLAEAGDGAALLDCGDAGNASCRHT